MGETRGSGNPLRRAKMCPRPVAPLQWLVAPPAPQRGTRSPDSPVPGNPPGAVPPDRAVPHLFRSVKNCSFSSAGCTRVSDFSHPTLQQGSSAPGGLQTLMAMPSSAGGATAASHAGHLPSPATPLGMSVGGFLRGNLPLLLQEPLLQLRSSLPRLSLSRLFLLQVVSVRAVLALAPSPRAATSPAPGSVVSLAAPAARSSGICLHPAPSIRSRERSQVPSCSRATFHPEGIPVCFQNSRN